jgi:hypothetical protein
MFILNNVTELNCLIIRNMQERMSLGVSRKFDYQAPEVEIIRLQSTQTLLQGSDKGGGGLPGGQSGEEIIF